MSLLDRPIHADHLDPSGMLQNVMDIPFHCQDARYRVLRRPPRLNPRGIRHIIVAGLGGSAIGGDILRTLVWKETPYSINVDRHYELPGWAGKDALVICSSYSGNTEETLSVFRQALARRCPLMIMSSGGELLRQAGRRNLPFCQVPGGLLPRAAAPGYSFMSLLTALECTGFLRSYEDDFQEAMGLLTALAPSYGWANPTARNAAKRLAAALLGKLPLLYAGQDHFESVALRWKGQLNENAKQLALMGMLPEMNHNEILGFTRSEPLSKKMAVLLLKNPQGDHPRISRRFELLKRTIRPRVASIHEVRAQGRSLLAQMLSAIYLGDFVSVYLAYLKGIDPTPIGLIDRFKKWLTLGGPTPGSRP